MVSLIDFKTCGVVVADIETYNVDTKLNKVIVTGNVTTEEVIRVLQKIGKNATPWEDAQSVASVA